MITSTLFDKNDKNIYFPEHEEEVVALVQYALDQKLTIRCKASGHSWPPGIATGRATFERGFKENPNAIYQTPTSETNQLNINLGSMKNNVVAELTPDEAGDIGLDWEYIWNDLNGDRKDVKVEGGLFKIGGGLVLGSNQNDGGNINIQEGVVYNLDKMKYALFDIGGIYSQTIAGYLSTGASGGSTQDSIELNIVAYKIVTYENGTAKTKIIRKEGGAGKVASAEEINIFNAYATSMGLLGITLEVYVRGIPRYAIIGYEVTTNLSESKETNLSECEIDMFGTGFDSNGNPKRYSFHYKKDGKDFERKGNRTSMKDFLQNSKYTRILWWPQQGVNRVTVWKADKIEIPKGGEDYPQEEVSNIMVYIPSSVIFDCNSTTHLQYPTPYQNPILGKRNTHSQLDPVTGNVEITVVEVLASLLLTIIGNLDDLSKIETKWLTQFQFGKSWLEEFENEAKSLVENAGVVDKSKFQEIPRILVQIVKCIGKELESKLIDKFVKLIIDEPKIIQYLYSTFGATRSNNGAQQFTDIWFEGLPMDKDTSYTIMPVTFTEMWFPIDRTTEVMKIVEDIFSPRDNVNQTRFAIEFYPGPKSNSWLSASGPWPDNVAEETNSGSVLRVDVYYFPYDSEEGVNNPKDMVSNGKKFFSNIWAQMLTKCAENKNPIPFKFHLGKYSGDIAKTKEYRNQYKNWNDWHEKRRDMDPNSIFINGYWSEKLGINETKQGISKRFGKKKRMCCLPQK